MALLEAEKTLSAIRKMLGDDAIKTRILEEIEEL